MAFSNKLNHQDKIKGFLTDKSPAWKKWFGNIWNWGIYNPFIMNTKYKFRRFFGLEKQEEKGYIQTSAKQFYERWFKMTSGSYSFTNPFTSSKSKIKRVVLYYLGLLFGFIMVLKALPLIFANLISGGGGSR